MGSSFESVPQLHRLHPNRIKLSEFVGLVPVSIAKHLKIFENLAKEPKWGPRFGVSQPKSDFWNFSILNDRKLKLSE